MIFQGLLGATKHEVCDTFVILIGGFRNNNETLLANLPEFDLFHMKQIMCEYTFKKCLFTLKYYTGVHK